VNRHSTEGSLVRELGVWGLAASIVNITIGGGIFRLPAAAAAQLGAAAPIAFIVCAIAMCLIVLCFAEAGSRVALTGGVYAYVEVAFGPLVGFLTGVMLWAGITVATAAVSSFFGDALVALIPALAPWRKIVITLILLALALLNIAGVRGANRFNALMTIAKLVPLGLLILFGFLSMNAANLQWTSTPDAGHLSRASVTIIFAFLGVETALVPGAEVREPARTIPRAIFLAMLFITVIYLIIQIVAQGVLGPALPGQQTPLAEAAAVAMGPIGRTVMLLGMAISMFGYVSGMTLAVPRTLYAFGRDGFLPAQLAAVHPRFHTPHVAIAIQTLVVILIATALKFEALAVIANGSILLVYAACCLAVIQLRRLHIEQNGTPFRVPLAATIPIIAFLLIVWLLGSLTAEEWKWLLAIVAVSVVVFAASLASRRQRMDPPSTSPT
jgi:APA family basic amino acid/polyamine antiporter